MPLLIAPLLCFAIGALLALAHPAPLGARTLARGRTVAALFALFDVWPALAYSATKEPAWSVLYTVDPRSVPAAALIAGTLAAAALTVLGYEVGVHVVLAASSTWRASRSASESRFTRSSRRRGSRDEKRPTSPVD